MERLIDSGNSEIWVFLNISEFQREREGERTEEERKRRKKWEVQSGPSTSAGWVHLDEFDCRKSGNWKSTNDLVNNLGR